MTSKKTKDEDSDRQRTKDEDRGRQKNKGRGQRPTKGQRTRTTDDKRTKDADRAQQKDKGRGQSPTKGQRTRTMSDKRTTDTDKGQQKEQRTGASNKAEKGEDQFGKIDFEKTTYLISTPLTQKGQQISFLQTVLFSTANLRLSSQNANWKAKSYGAVGQRQNPRERKKFCC